MNTERVGTADFNAVRLVASLVIGAMLLGWVITRVYRDHVEPVLTSVYAMGQGWYLPTIMVCVIGVLSLLVILAIGVDWVFARLGWKGR